MNTFVSKYLIIYFKSRQFNSVLYVNLLVNNCSHEQQWFDCIDTECKTVNSLKIVRQQIPKSDYSFLVCCIVIIIMSRVNLIFTKGLIIFYLLTTSFACDDSLGNKNMDVEGDIDTSCLSLNQSIIGCHSAICLL